MVRTKTAIEILYSRIEKLQNTFSVKKRHLKIKVKISKHGFVFV